MTTCTRAAAVDAGWQLSPRHPGDALVLVHSGAEGASWQLARACSAHGEAVAAFKARRRELRSGAAAVWHAGRLSRFDLAALPASISFKV